MGTDNNKKRTGYGFNFKSLLSFSLLIVAISEVFFFHYIQQVVKTEFVSKTEFDDVFLKKIKNIYVRIEQIQNGLDRVMGAESRRKRSAMVLNDNTVIAQETVQEPGDGPHVEFFNPKLKHELQEKDEEKARSGQKADSWVWLTSYSRIPLMAIQGFCSATKDYCPPGKEGQAGNPGFKGEKGDHGDAGPPGLPGPAGVRGLRGPPGDVGWPGSPGLDGRDGVPGEPGLDGVPGRSGLDGIPGEPGLPGKDGLPGRDGRNGTDGKPGMTGPQGPTGLQGPRGSVGPRGRPGKPGNHGSPGIPGITAWKYRGNGTNDLLVPPSMAGSVFSHRAVVVQEGEHLLLRCTASGIPKPDVFWRKIDSTVISLGSWQVSSTCGESLNITRVNRAHMGIYQCIANNGVPPQANQTFHLEVHFPPLIRIRNQMVGASNGSIATLECEVEAFPEAVRYWERGDGRLLDNGEKYRVDNSAQRHGYRAVMRLSITRINYRDYTQYHCIAKNERGITKGVFNVYEIDPRVVTPPSITDGSEVAVYGVLPPDLISQEDLCPPQIACPRCLDPKDYKCKGVVVSYLDLIDGLELRPFGNKTFYELPNRISDCQLYAVGKPVFHRFTDLMYGCWMRDPSPPNEASADKYWVTREKDDYSLYEYVNKSVFRTDMPTKTYVLEHPFRGNSHVIYNGSFFYNERDKPRIIKFNLDSRSYQALDVTGAATNGSNYLYTTGYNYMDFNVDDNGLWVIYGLYDKNNTIVMKVDTNKMEAQYIWNVSLNHHKIGEMFIVCGVLYAVDSVKERNAKIPFALDLYTGKLLDVNLNFTNPFRNTTMLGYNHKNKELYTWDKGNQLTYPIRYHEVGFNSSGGDRHDMDVPGYQMHTAYDTWK